MTSVQVAALCSLGISAASLLLIVLHMITNCLENLSLKFTTWQTVLQIKRDLRRKGNNKAVLMGSHYSNDRDIIFIQQDVNGMYVIHNGGWKTFLTASSVKVAYNYMRACERIK